MTITEKFKELKGQFNLKNVPAKVIDTFLEQLNAKMIADVSSLGGNPFIIDENTKDIEEQNKIIEELENDVNVRAKQEEAIMKKVEDMTSELETKLLRLEVDLTAEELKDLKKKRLKEIEKFKDGELENITNSIEVDNDIEDKKQKLKKAKEHLIEIEQNLKDVEKGEKQRIKFVNYYLEMIENFKTLTD